MPRFTGTADLILTPATGRSVAATLGPASTLFLVNHGIGPTLRAVTVAAIVLERAACQQWITRGSGTWPTWSDPGESLDTEAVDRVCYLVRRLPGR
ncbi:hypothetical protein ACIBKY_32955 [Nonomuraea sp. NPDC050394]|uniref:hypothetical protein n=1 Tax=Nonomuraea sp. NPDC050394 TaxID=3364363 RepID=UPI0037AE7708